MKTVRPGKTQLFCRPDKAETQTASGFFIADKAAEKPKTAEVINVGADVDHYKQKDTVIYKPYAITEIRIDDQDFFLVDEQDVLGTIVEVS